MTVGSVEYDSEYGYPLEYITKYKNSYSESFINNDRTLYGNYQSFSSVNGETSDADEAEPEYFNLQGVRVQNPSNGIFILRQGNKVSKVAIR